MLLFTVPVMFHSRTCLAVRYRGSPDERPLKECNPVRAMELNVAVLSRLQPPLAGGKPELTPAPPPGFSERRWVQERFRWQHKSPKTRATNKSRPVAPVTTVVSSRQALRMSSGTRP